MATWGPLPSAATPLAPTLLPRVPCSPRHNFSWQKSNGGRGKRRGSAYDLGQNISTAPSVLLHGLPLWT